MGDPRLASGLRISDFSYADEAPKNLSLRRKTDLPLSIKIKPDLLTTFLSVYKLSGYIMVKIQLCMKGSVFNENFCFESTGLQSYCNRVKFRAIVENFHVFL